MKKLLERLLSLFIILSLLLSLFGCNFEFDFDFDRKPGGGGGGDGGDGTEESLVIGGGTATEWGSGGYAIATTLTDKEPKVVTSLAEANAWIDAAIMSHFHSLTIDYSAVAGYSPTEDNIEIELSNHVRIEKRYYDSNPKVVEFVISYEEDAATFFATPTEENDHTTLLSGNYLLRFSTIPKAERRSEDFDGFKINSVEETLEVYNSEELWLALSRGYRPTFPLENSKAESFYLEAKRILRYIVTDSMTDYEKLLAIYEYLVSAVEYDYDSFYAGDNGWHGVNACYYLEGVFEAGRAVCDGKAKALVLFASIEGIKCVRDFGKNLTSGISHAWNYVYLDGEWYLVDTTEGDVCHAGDVADFLGDSAEMVGYDSFLCPVDYYEGVYEYSEVCAVITDNFHEYSVPSRTAEHYRTGLNDDSEIDFVIDKHNELSQLCILLFSVADDTPVTLTVKYEQFIGIQGAMYTIMSDKDWEYAIFVLDDANREYLIIFKPILVLDEQ